MLAHKKTGHVRVVVTAPGGNLARHAAALKQKGMNVDSVLEGIGVITGSVSEKHFSALKSVPGLTVERDQTVQLAPPDAAVQ